MHSYDSAFNGALSDRKPLSLSTSATDNQSLLAKYFKLSDRQRKFRFVSTAEVAEKFNISQRTVQRWIAKGYVKALHIGKRYQIDLLSVIAYLEQCEAMQEQPYHLFT